MMNFSYMVLALIVAFGLKELIVVLKDTSPEASRFIGIINVGGCILALANYSKWLIL